MTAGVSTCAVLDTDISDDVSSGDAGLDEFIVWCRTVGAAWLLLDGRERRHLDDAAIRDTNPSDASIVAAALILQADPATRYFSSFVTRAFCEKWSPLQLAASPTADPALLRAWPADRPELNRLLIRAASDMAAPVLAAVCASNGCGERAALARAHKSAIYNQDGEAMYGMLSETIVLLDLMDNNPASIHVFATLVADMFGDPKWETLRELAAVAAVVPH